MKRHIKFPLFMDKNIPVRTLEDFRKYFEIKKALLYYENGRLAVWLRDRYYDELSEKVCALKKNDPELVKKLCNILGIKYKKEFDISLDDVRKENSYLDKVKAITGNQEIIRNYNAVAFTQEKFDKLINDSNIENIYLYGDKFELKFNIDEKKINKKTICGINKPSIFLKNIKYQRLIKEGFKFQNVIFKKVDFCISAKAHVGDTIVFGNYNNTALTWIVLKSEENEMKLFSMCSVNKMPIGGITSGSKYRVVSETEIWRENTVRKWLNEVFYLQVFDEIDKAAIISEENEVNSNVSLPDYSDIDKYKNIKGSEFDDEEDFWMKEAKQRENYTEYTTKNSTLYKGQSLENAVRPVITVRSGLYSVSISHNKDDVKVTLLSNLSYTGKKKMTYEKNMMTKHKNLPLTKKGEDNENKR